MHFSKYQAAGNDFILLDNRNHWFDKENNQLIRQMCHRNFGIGADGLILLENDLAADFKMIYFNADGYEGSMCGNGGRCIAAYACEIMNTGNNIRFIAFDGFHEAKIISENNNRFVVRLSLNKVTAPTKFNDDYILDTGSPHYVQFVGDNSVLDVVSAGKQIRYNHPFTEKGINVNFVKIINNNNIHVRTYERGVENETLSCGTGITASAIASYVAGHTRSTQIEVASRGGNLKVSFEPGNDSFDNIYLEGEAIKVFEGKLSISDFLNAE